MLTADEQMSSGESSEMEESEVDNMMSNLHHLWFQKGLASSVTAQSAPPPLFYGPNLKTKRVSKSTLRLHFTFKFRLQMTSSSQDGSTCIL